MSDQLVPATIEQSEISSNLNSILLYTFLMGIYTIVYFGTLYAYLSRKPTQRLMIVAAITALYVLTLLQFVLQWWTLSWQFVQNGDTRDDIFNAVYIVPDWIVVTTPIVQYFVLMLADALLIWRCFYVWRSSWRVVALPLFLWVAVVGLSISSIAYEGLVPPKIASPQQSFIANSLLSATLFLSCSSSVVTTGLIAYRILSVSKLEGGSVRRFKHILDIVVQSSAFYSLSLLVTGISNALPDSASNSETLLFAFGSYATAQSLVIAGLAPTVMVARTALLRSEATYPSTAPHQSILRFQQHATIEHETRGGSESVVVIDSPHSGSTDEEKNGIS